MGAGLTELDKIDPQIGSVALGLCCQVLEVVGHIMALSDATLCSLPTR